MPGLGVKIRQGHGIKPVTGPGQVPRIPGLGNWITGHVTQVAGSDSTNKIKQLPIQAFPGKDGHWVIAAIGNDNPWAQYCATLGRNGAGTWHGGAR